MVRFLVGRFAGWAVWCLPLVLLSCGDEKREAPFDPSCPVRMISGVVRTPEQPLSAGIVAEYKSLGQETSAQIRTVTDRSGNYRLLVPEGDYILYATFSGRRPGVYYSQQGLRSSGSEADIVSVRGGDLQADFIFGGLEVLIDLPPELEGVALTCVAQGQEFNNRPEYSPERTVTGQSVRFHFSLLIPDAYKFYVRSTGLWNVWLPSSHDAEHAVTLNVAAGEIQHYMTRWGRPARISGEVRGSWRLLADNPPRVEAHDEDRETISYAVVDSAGNFSLDLFVPEPARLGVVIDQSERWIGGDSFEEATVFDLDPGEAVSGISVIESGMVIRLSGPGLYTRTEARLELVRTDGRIAAQRRSEGSSALSLPNLDPGIYYLWIAHTEEPQIWMDQWYERQDSLATATPIVVPGDGGMVSVTAHLIEGGSISGRILRRDGSPADRWVYPYFATSSHSLDREARTDEATGAFRIVGLQDGKYKVMTYREGLNGNWWYPGTADEDSAAVIRIRGHNQVTGIDWSLPE